MNNINLEIKVPVYITEWKEFNSMPLFSESKNTEISYETIYKSVKQKINDYNNRIIQEVKKRKKSKVKETYIEYIKSDDIKIDNKTSILLNITAFDIKNKDLSIENKFREFNLTEDDKLKKNNNYVLMYPQITGDLSFKYRWLFFLYEDPYKESIDFIHTVKLALKIFDLKLVNVKSKMLIEELKKAKNNYIPEIEVISKSENQTVNSEFRDFAEFHIESNKATTQKDFFENIPLEKVEFLIKSKNKNRWTKRIFKIKNGKKEYKYTREYDNNFIESKEVGETFFNTVIPIKACEMEQIHSSEYIIDILKPVILEYTRSYGD